MLDHPPLKRYVEDVLGPELRRVTEAVIVPLGRANDAIRHLCDRGDLSADQCLVGLPHPSPVNTHRHRLFAERKEVLLQHVEQLTAPSAASNRFA